MIIRLATKKDAVQIAKIHKEEIKKGFLSRLGERFLSLFYEAIIFFPDSFVVVAEEDGRVIGFVSGCLNINEFYKKFFKKYAVWTFFVLLPKIYSLVVIKKIFETKRYSQHTEENLPKEELLTIAVKGDFKGRGISKDIFERFVFEMKQRNVKSFKVVVGGDLERAIGFYEKMGLSFHSEIFIHKGAVSRIYIYQVIA